MLRPLVSVHGIAGRINQSANAASRRCLASAENEEADDSQQGPEDEGEECRPQPLRRQRRQTQGRREDIHHLREGDAFLRERPRLGNRATLPASGNGIRRR